MSTATAKRLKVGRAVKIVDPLRAMKTCLNRDLGDGKLYGAGGCRLPEGILEQPAIIAVIGQGGRRVLIDWGQDRSMWIDTDNLEKT